MKEDYLKINQNSWNQRLAAHLDSEFYDMASFLNGRSSLNSIELDLLGDISGKTILHLQCHFGQDTISMARRGASVLGVDLSDQAVHQGRALAKQLDADARFVHCDVYDAPNRIDEKFDLVFTSYGVIGWLPDINRWAAVIDHFLKPGGRLVFVEFHPAVWMFDDELKEVKYRYFNSDPIVEEENGSYADREADIQLNYVCWNHGLGEVISALIKQGMKVEHFNEYDFSPYPIFAKATQDEPGKYRPVATGNKMPLVYSIVATKAAN